ncbi:ribbon-helix-helix protein, CopG family [Sphingomonas sp. 22176]|uniref:ribbon-helix-helix protein, CopG family n=1 Tax=Sphingomonas sp. 22176 TaxID=3453884 RepID=UPI003F879196
MKKPSLHYTVRLPRELHAQLEAEAKRQGCSNAELTREALERYLRSEQILRDSDERLRRICEYTQLALDVMIQEDLPERRDGILLEVNNRMERYHGAR